MIYVCTCASVLFMSWYLNMKYFRMSQSYSSFTPVSCLENKMNFSRADTEPMKETIIEESERATPKARG